MAGGMTDDVCGSAIGRGPQGLLFRRQSLQIAPQDVAIGRLAVN
jgi:hypothetical protein